MRAVSHTSVPTPGASCRTRPTAADRGSATCSWSFPPPGSRPVRFHPCGVTSSSRPSRARDSRRRSWTSRSPAPSPARSPGSTIRSCGSSCSTCPGPPPGTWIMAPSAPTRPARSTSSSICADPRSSARKPRGRQGVGRRCPRRSRSSSSTARSTPTWTAPSSCGSASSTWPTSAARVTRAGGPDAAAAAPPRELPPARRYRARVRSRDHGDHRAERLRQDVYPRGDRLGAVRRAGGARGQGLDPPARREGSGGRRGGPRVPPRRPRVPREARAFHRGAPPGRPGDREFAQGGHRQAGAHLGNDPRRVLQHLLHGAKGVGRDGGARQDGAGGVPVARARVRAAARGAGAGARSPQRGGGGGAGSRGRPPRRRGARRGAAGRGTATDRGPQVGQERGRGAEAGARELHGRLEAVERAAEEERTVWVRDRQYAETKRTELLKQYEEVKEQRDQIVKLGPEGTCPTCKRPLGPEYAGVLALLDAQLEVITVDGKYFRQRLEQLAQSPAKLLEAETERDRVLEESRRASARAGELRAQVEERDRASAELVGARRRASDLERRLTARPAGYDPARHDAVRAELAKLEPVALEAAALEERARRAERLVQDAEHAEHQLSAGERRVRELTDAVRGEGLSDAEYRQAKDRYDRAVGALREAELAVVEARGELNRAEDDLAETKRRVAERAQRERQIAALKARQRLHNELDRAFSDLRGELNARMRPEIAELASGFLADLTDGRYDELELTEDYTLTILEGGVPKPVISGGEEDIASLVLRLAISQMIAERAGQPLSLLVLDEIFGSLDEARRLHVVGLLRRLADRFPQVILITHIEQVREGLDRVIRVDFDPARGTSVVRDDTATLGAADAGVAA